MTVEATGVVKSGEVEKCGLDMSSYEDLHSTSPKSAMANVECNGGGGGSDGKDDYVIVNDSDAASSEDHDGDGVELSVEGGIGGKLDSGVKVENGELKVESNGVYVGAEGEGVVKANGEIKAEGEGVGVLDGELGVVEESVVSGVEVEESGAENGGDGDVSVDGVSGSLDDDDDNKLRDVCGVVDCGPSEEEVVPNGVAVVEAEPQVPDDEEQRGVVQPQEDESQGDGPDERIDDEVRDPEVVEDNGELHKDEVQVNEPESMDSELKKLEADVRHESLENGLAESQQSDGNSEVRDPEVVDDIGELHKDEVQVNEPESMDSELEQVEADVRHESVEDGSAEAQQSDGIAEIPCESESSESQLPGVEAKGLPIEDVIPVKHSLDCQQQDIQPADEENKVLDSVAAETEVRGQGDLDSPVAGGSQAVNSLDSEAEIGEVDQNGVDEIKDQNTPDLAAESVETQELQTLHSQAEEAECRGDFESEASVVEVPVSVSTDQSDECKLELTSEVEESSGASAADMQSATTDKPAADCRLEKVNGEEKSQLTTEVGSSQETSAAYDALPDQVAEEARRLLDVIVKEVSPVDVTLETNETSEDATSLSKPQFADGEAVEECGNDLSDNHAGDSVSGNGVVDELVNDSRTVPIPGESSDVVEGCLRPEDCSLSAPVDSAMDLSAPSDSDTIIQQGVGDYSSSVADDSLSFTAEDTSSQPKSDSSNGETVLDNKSDGETVSNDVDVASTSSHTSDRTCGSDKIFFGSIECSSDISTNHVSNSSTEPSTSQSDVAVKSCEDKANPSNGDALLDSQANGICATQLNHGSPHARLVHPAQISTDGVSAIPREGSVTDSSDEQVVNPDLVRKPFYWLIRIPRYADSDLEEQIRQANERLEEKVQVRNTLQEKIRKQKALIKEVFPPYNAARMDVTAASDLVQAKRLEIRSAQYSLNLAKNAKTVEDYNRKINDKEYMIQHETMTLNEEKQLIREIKQLKHERDQCSADPRGQNEIRQALDQRIQTEEHLKILQKEMDALRDNQTKAIERQKPHQKIHNEAKALLVDLNVKLESAEKDQQAAFAELQTLKSPLSKKRRQFYDYKNDLRKAYDYAAAGEKDSLEHHCISQVEKIMELWNKNDEFRKEYIQHNKFSTLRRFETPDGRRLGPEEEPPSRGKVSDHTVHTVAKINTVTTAPVAERDFPVVARSVEDKSLKKIIEQKNKTSMANKLVEAASVNNLPEASGETKIKEEKEERKPTKEEDELARKAEQLRREEEARLREQRILDDKRKAKEALEKKKRQAEVNKAKHEHRERKEAERKEKEREKRAKKKAKKKGLNSEATEAEPVPPESSSETVREPEVTEKPVTVTKKPQKVPQKQSKTIKSPPAALRNKGKRKFMKWSWSVLLTLLAIATVFFLGNSDIYQMIKGQFTRLTQ